MPDDASSGAANYAALYQAICTEWNLAEEAVKQAEQVCNEVIIPSVTELRYAGRRLIQALEIASAGGPSDEFEKLLNDALFNCHRARHDAIDAATSQMALVTNIASKKLGYSAVLKAFPGFPAFAYEVTEVRARIAETRGSAATRDQVYESIQSTSLPELVRKFNEFRFSEPMMVALAQRERWTYALSIGLGIIGIALTLIFGWLTLK